MADKVRHQQVDTNKWIDVPKGMILAPDTYVDISGVLRSRVDDSCVVWHYKGCVKTGIHESEIVYDEKTNAPWCPICWQRKVLKEHFNAK